MTSFHHEIAAALEHTDRDRLRIAVAEAIEGTIADTRRRLAILEAGLERAQTDETFTLGADRSSNGAAPTDELPPGPPSAPAALPPSTPSGPRSLPDPAPQGEKAHTGPESGAGDDLPLCPCGDPIGGPPCTADEPCTYAEGMPAARWPEPSPPATAPDDGSTVATDDATAAHDTSVQDLSDTSRPPVSATDRSPGPDPETSRQDLEPHGVDFARAAGLAPPAPEEPEDAAAEPSIERQLVDDTNLDRSQVHKRMKVMRFLLDHGEPAGGTEISVATSLSKQTVGRLLRSLHEAGKVERTGGKAGPTVRWAPSPHVLELAAKLRRAAGVDEHQEPETPQQLGERVIHLLEELAHAGRPPLHVPEIASRLEVTPGAAGAAIALLHHAGRTYRDNHGAYQLDD